METLLSNEMERPRLCWSVLVLVLIAVDACVVLWVEALLFLMHMLTFVLPSFGCLGVSFGFVAGAVEIDLTVLQIMIWRRTLRISWGSLFDWSVLLRHQVLVAPSRVDSSWQSWIINKVSDYLGAQFSWSRNDYSVVVWEILFGCCLAMFFCDIPNCCGVTSL